MEKVESSLVRRSTLSKVAGTLLPKKSWSAMWLSSQQGNASLRCHFDSVSRKNLASAIEQHGSGRRSLSESLLVDPNSGPSNVSLRKQFYNEETPDVNTTKSSEDKSSFRIMEQNTKPPDSVVDASHTDDGHADETSSTAESDKSNLDTQGSESPQLEGENPAFQEIDGKLRMIMPSGAYQIYEAKLASLLRKNGILEGQLASAISARESAEKNLSSAVRSRQEMEQKLGDSLKEIELLKEKLTSVELAQEEANSLSNIVHSDNVRLEHDVAFFKAVLDDTQMELHSTRGVLAGERARAFQLQVEVFHLKQRLQSLETRAPTPRKPFHV